MTAFFLNEVLDPRTDMVVRTYRFQKGPKLVSSANTEGNSDEVKGAVRVSSCTVAPEDEVAATFLVRQA